MKPKVSTGITKNARVFLGVLYAIGFVDGFAPLSTYHRASANLWQANLGPLASSFLLYEEQMKALARQGEKEHSLLSYQGDLEPSKYDVDALLKKKAYTAKKKKKKNAKKTGGVGFGGKAQNQKILRRIQLDPSALALGHAQAETLRQRGVIRINEALTRETATALRDFVLSDRDMAVSQVSSGSQEHHARFSDLMLNSNRYDLLLPLAGTPIVEQALSELFGAKGTLRPLYEAMLGDSAELFEFSSLISEPGAQRQIIHYDAPFMASAPLFTNFIALQDVSEEMGPTTFLPDTHTQECHEAFEDPARKEDFLKCTPAYEAILRAGDVAVFDSRTLHAGGRNDESHGTTRGLFYFSIRDPAVPYPTVGAPNSLRPAYVNQDITLGGIYDRLDSATSDGQSALGEYGDGLDERGDAVVLERARLARSRNAPIGSL